MQVLQSIRKGEGHSVFCEDFQVVENLGTDWTIAAVMDGCSSGKESHFASSLFGKALRNSINRLDTISNKQNNFELSKARAENIGLFLAEDMFTNLKSIKNYLSLNYNELLSTLILLVYNTKSKETWILASGDGYVAINNKISKIDQNNQPDYMAFYFSIEFNEWIKEHALIFNKENVSQIAISTDGIGSFFKLTGQSIKSDIIRNLLVEKVNDSLDHIIDALEDNDVVLHYDDISLIRIVNK